MYKGFTSTGTKTSGGGAYTGDSTSKNVYQFLTLFSTLWITFLLYKHRIAGRDFMNNRKFALHSLTFAQFCYKFKRNPNDNSFYFVII